MISKPFPLLRELISRSTVSWILTLLRDIKIGARGCVYMEILTRSLSLMMFSPPSLRKSKKSTRRPARHTASATSQRRKCARFWIGSMDLRGMRVFGSAGIKRLIANNSKALEDYILRGFSGFQMATRESYNTGNSRNSPCKTAPCSP